MTYYHDYNKLYSKGAATLQKSVRSESSEARIEGAKRPRFEGEARERAGGGGLGEGLTEPLLRKSLEFQTSNRSIWCIVEKENLK